MAKSRPNRVSVALLPQLLQPAEWSDFTTAIVIDTLRFTTTACQALGAGAASLEIAASIEAARAISVGDKNSLLCGERHCHRIEGFDLGNSPFEYIAPIVGGRNLVFTTTNGTLAVAAVQRAKTILLGALVNRAATCRYVCNSGSEHLVIVCAGTDGFIASEDALTAGAIIDSLACDDWGTLANDSAWLALQAWNGIKSKVSGTDQVGDAIAAALAGALGGRNLLDGGFAQDVQYAARLDSIDIVPRRVETEGSKFTI